MAKQDRTKTSSRSIQVNRLSRFHCSRRLVAVAKRHGCDWKDRALQYVDNREVLTLEARYLPEQIAAAHRQGLVSDDQRNLENTVLKYYPYLLLDVKYTDGNKTREGVLLWGLSDGEIVLNTDTWEMTHGFRDCLECQANRSDFKIIQTLAQRHGAMGVEELRRELQLEPEVIEQWIVGAKQKNLIVQKGTLLQLHFENPKLLVIPQTRINQHLVSKPLGEGQKIPRAYSRNTVIATAKNAFVGNNFTIRSEQEVFLPVYSLEVRNPDGSSQRSEWNAITGQRIIPYYLTGVLDQNTG